MLLNLFLLNFLSFLLSEPLDFLALSLFLLILLQLLVRLQEDVIDDVDFGLCDGGHLLVLLNLLVSHTLLYDVLAPLEIKLSFKPLYYVSEQFFCLLHEADRFFG